MNRIKALIPTLPREAWIILSADGVGALGSGLILPFFMIYLNEVRGIDLDVAGFALATQAIVGFVAGPVGGTLIDRFGARRMLVASMIVTGTAAFLIVQIREPWHAFAVAGYLGIGHAAFWPSIQSLLGTVVRPSQRSNVFSMQFAILNAGIGIGALIGGSVVDVDRPTTFAIVYTIQGALGLVAAAFIYLSRAGAGIKTVDDPEEPEAQRGGYRDVLRDRVFLRVAGLQIFLVTVGYAQLESAFPPYATGEGGISEQALGIAFFANTATIVIAQLVVLKKLEGRRRTRGLMLLFSLWALCWSAMLAVGELATGALAVLGFVFCMILFASGETLLSPTVPPIVNDLSPDRLRGRYNALYSLCWSAGHTVGPPIAGVLLDQGRPRILFGGLTVACLLGIAFARSLERHLTPEINVVTPDEGPEPAGKEGPAPGMRPETEPVG